MAKYLSRTAWAAVALSKPSFETMKEQTASPLRNAVKPLRRAGRGLDAGRARGERRVWEASEKACDAPAHIVQSVVHVENERRNGLRLGAVAESRH